MSERAQTFKIAKIPADGVGREVVEAGQRVLNSVAVPGTERPRQPTPATSTGTLPSASRSRAADQSPRRTDMALTRIGAVAPAKRRAAHVP